MIGSDLSYNCESNQQANKSLQTKRQHRKLAQKKKKGSYNLQMFFSLWLLLLDSYSRLLSYRMPMQQCNFTWLTWNQDAAVL
mmetsp:Transcript_29145/g.60969  ORF Transcript_29145/g.60969 Transcript_29145/m.60969 type:complete len:82 (-) Transcript_29145:128-373(-)